MHLCEINIIDFMRPKRGRSLKLKGDAVEVVQQRLLYLYHWFTNDRRAHSIILPDGNVVMKNAALKNNERNKVLKKTAKKYSLVNSVLGEKKFIA